MKKHLDKALERKAFIIDVGDSFDAMQGRFDPRRSYSNMRKEYVSDTYLDDIVESAAEFMGPYAKNFLMIGRGNHDQSIKKNNGTDLISNLVHRLNTDSGGKVHVGHFGGYVKLQLTIHGTTRDSINIKYHHGAGGGGEVTRGVIQTNRQAVYLPDADIVVNGHTHDAWIVPITRERLSSQGVTSNDTLWFVRTPTYQDDFGYGEEGWHVERWGPPKPRGCAWLKLTFDGSKKISIEPTIDIA